MAVRESTRARAAEIMQERNRQVYLPVFRDEIWKAYAKKLDSDRMLCSQRWSRASQVFPNVPFRSKKFPLRDFTKDKIAIKFPEIMAEQFLQQHKNPRVIGMFVSNPPLVSHYKHEAAEQQAVKGKFRYPDTTSQQVGWLAWAARRYAYKGEKPFSMRNLNESLGQPSDFHCYT